MMKQLIFLSIIFLTACTFFEKKDTGTTDSSPIVVENPEITKLKARAAISEAEIIKLKAMDAKLIADTQYKAKQILTLTKSLSATNVLLNSKSAQLSNEIAMRKRDSTLLWAATKPLIPLTPKVNSFIAIFKSDSTKQWFDINKLKGVTPVTAIPVMQSQIKVLQTQVSGFTVKNDSLQNLITKYATKLDLNQFTISGSVATITGWNSLQTRVTTLEKLQPPGGQK